MSHLDVDQFASTSRLFAFDPRVKLVVTIALIAVLAFMTTMSSVLVILLFILLLILASDLPFKHMAMNYGMALVFILFASLTMLLTSGWEAALTMFMRISASVLALLLMVATTPFFKTLKAFQWLRVPKVLCTLIMFTYRFIFVLLEEMGRMRMARKARGFGGGKSLLDRMAFATISSTIGMVFVRSNLRASHIYDALLSRGYSGEIILMDELKMAPRDVGLAVLFGAVAAFAVMLQVGAIPWTQ